MVRHFVGETCDEVWRAAATELNAGTGAIRSSSRQGDTLEYLHCVFEVSDPLQRWVFSRRPALNPAFAIAEVIWILLGSRCAKFINYWNPRLPQFAGAGDTYHGAYGHRLRKRFGVDQIDRACDALHANPDSRQVVLQIWDAPHDLPHRDGTPRDPDIPCNLISMLKVRDGALHWTQVLRSNDIYLGTPHNFVQFTALQEVVSGCLGVAVGPYVQLSDSLHMYVQDSGVFSVSGTQVEARNSDRLGLPRNELVEVLRILAELTAELTSAGLSPAAIRRIAAEQVLPSAWSNLVCVLAADAARRHQWVDETGAAMAGCTNPALQLAWSGWHQRTRS